MQTIKFQTTINCGSCVKAVTPVLDRMTTSWEVDTDDPKKTLTVQTDKDSKSIAEALKETGFEAKEVV